MDFKEKYPLLTLDDSMMDVEESYARRVELWERQKTLRVLASNYVPNIDMFLGCNFHDSIVHSIRMEGDSLYICVEDYISQGCFKAVNGLLNLGIPEKTIQCPVVIKLDELRNLKLYKYSDDESIDYLPVTPEVLLQINEYIYDEIADITPDNLSIGFELFTKENYSIFLDIDAQKISFAEDLRLTFIGIFGEKNLDLYDAFWHERTIQNIYDYKDHAIRIIRNLRPDRPTSYDIKNYYIRYELEMNAKIEEEVGNLERAAEIYRELIFGKYEFDLCKKLGKCLFRLGQFNEALLYLNAFAGQYSTDIDVRFHLARAWYALGSYPYAAEELDLCLEKDPNHGGVLKFIEEHPEIRKYMDQENHT